MSFSRAIFCVVASIAVAAALTVTPVQINEAGQPVRADGVLKRTTSYKLQDGSGLGVTGITFNFQNLFNLSTGALEVLDCVETCAERNLVRALFEAPRVCPCASVPVCDVVIGDLGWEFVQTVDTHDTFGFLI
jgi:hypothetical protein